MQAYYAYGLSVSVMRLLSSAGNLRGTREGCDGRVSKKY